MKRLMLTALVMLMFCAPAYAAGKYSVQGTVILASGDPAAGFTVQLLEKKTEANLLRGTVRTAQNGTYKINYSPRRSLKGTSYFVRSWMAETSNSTNRRLSLALNS